MFFLFFFNIELYSVFRCICVYASVYICTYTCVFFLVLMPLFPPTEGAGTCQAADLQLFFSAVPVKNVLFVAEENAFN